MKSWRPHLSGLAVVVCLLCALVAPTTRDLAGAGEVKATSRRAHVVVLRGGRGQVSDRGKAAMPKQEGEDVWDGKALQRRIRELKQGGDLKDFLDGLYLPTVPRSEPHAASAADVIRPANRFAMLGAEDLSVNQTALTRFHRILRAFKRGQHGEPLAAESSSGSSVFGSTAWDSDKLEEAFPSEGDQDPLAYRCEYVQGPRVYKYLSGKRMERWHAAATKRFNRLQKMDSDEFADGVDDELKYERDIFQECVVNINGSKAIVSKAPFFPGEAGYVGPDGQMVPGPVVSHTKALTQEEIQRLPAREQARYEELYGKERIEMQRLHAAREDGDELLLQAEALGFDASRRGGPLRGNTTRSEGHERGTYVPEEFKLRDKIPVLKKGDWRDSEMDSSERQRQSNVEEGDSDLDFPVALPYKERDIYKDAVPEPPAAKEEIKNGHAGLGGLGKGDGGIFSGLGSLPWNADGIWKSAAGTDARGDPERTAGVGVGEKGDSAVDSGGKLGDQGGSRLRPDATRQRGIL